MAGEQEYFLVEQRKERMVSSTDSQRPLTRYGWFHKNMQSINTVSYRSPFQPSLHRVTFHSLAGWSTMVFFKGWRSPQRKWESWVNKLRPLYANLWRKVGIYDAIEASTYKIFRDQSSLSGIVDFWCEKTNTFIFPNFEASITLEDIMVLGGFPVIGRCIRKQEPLGGNSVEIYLEMIREHRAFSGRAAKKASHSAWLNHFIERDGDELEHIAFLSLWLSRYVFPQLPEGLVREDVFPIAISLSHGTKFAIGPAILADLYRDLRILKKKISSDQDNEAPPITLWSPFQILQIWIWEHFVALRPKAHPHFLQYSKPRAARWHKLHVEVGVALVRSILESHDEFQWRPYTAHLDHWRMPSFYRDNGEWVYGNADEGIESFAHCLRPSQLVGLDSIEQYFPDRVAMQFGLDQDIPHHVPNARENWDWELAWENYDQPVKTCKLYIPPRLFESDITLQYLIWWLDVHRSDNRNKNDTQGPNSLAKSMGSSEMEIRQRKRKGILLPYGIKQQNLEVDSTLSDFSGRSQYERSQKHKNAIYYEFFPSGASIGEKVRESVDVLGQTKGQVGEASASDLLNIETGGSIELANITNTGESVDNPIVLDNADDTHLLQKPTYKSGEMEKGIREREATPLGPQISELLDVADGLYSRPKELHIQFKAQTGKASEKKT